MPRCINQFELLTELYRGKTSLLHEAIDKCSGSRVAVKQYRKAQLSPLNRCDCGCIWPDRALDAWRAHPQRVA